METNYTDLHKITRLPLEVFVKVDTAGKDIAVHTPHKGRVIIEMKDTHHPFIFGSTTQTERTAHDVIGQIHRLESEAIDYLLKQFAATINPY